MVPPQQLYFKAAFTTMVPPQPEYVGVRQRRWGTWVSEIRHPLLKTRVWLGTYETAEDAARAYDEAARMMCGPRARTNFPYNPIERQSPSAKELSAYLMTKLHKCHMTYLKGGNKSVSKKKTKKKNEAQNQSVNRGNKDRKGSTSGSPVENTNNDRKGSTSGSPVENTGQQCSRSVEDDQLIEEMIQELLDCNSVVELRDG